MIPKFMKSVVSTPPIAPTSKNRPSLSTVTIAPVTQPMMMGLMISAT